jgi:hypothetical protein
MGGPQTSEGNEFQNLQSVLYLASWGFPILYQAEITAQVSQHNGHCSTEDNEYGDTLWPTVLTNKGPLALLKSDDPKMSIPGVLNTQKEPQWFTGEMNFLHSSTQKTNLKIKRGKVDVMVKRR